MMTAFNGVRVGRWTINRPLLLLALLAPLALTGCPGTTTTGGTGVDGNVAPRPVLNDGALAQGDTLQGQVGIALSFDAAGSDDSDGTVTGYEWDFGDGSPLETEASVTHSYAEPGEYTVALTVIDNAGQRTTLTITVVVSGADPVASFTATPTSGQAPLTVDFDASASSDSDGVIVAYAWDPGDGSGPFGGVTSSYTYETGGTFTATLTVDDNDGHSGSMSLDIEVQAANQLPLAVLVAAPLTGPEPLTVEFDATGSSDPDGTIVGYVWDYGDGSDLGAGVETSHVYATAGTYTAELTVTDNEGATGSAPVEITVGATNLAPTAIIGADPTSGPAPLMVTFDAAGSSDPEDGTDDLKYLWGFGESTCLDSGGGNLGIACTSDSDCPSEATCNEITATDTPTPFHIYDVEGIYTATLTVSDELNLASATVSIQIEVAALEAVVVSLAVDTSFLELDPTDPAQTHQLIVTGTLSDASEAVITDDPDTIYTSDDDLIATVSDGGLITAVADGVATVTVSRTDPAVAPVDVTVNVSAVTLSASASVFNLPAEGHFHPGMHVGLDLDILGGIGNPETDDFTYDWNLDISGASGSLLDDSDFMDEDTMLTSFRPDVEGAFVVNCVVTDNVGTMTVTTSDLTITVIALTAEPVVMGNTGCIVGPPSDVEPPGADGPGTIQEEHTFVTLEADVMGQLGEVDYLWSATANEADFGLFDDPMVATPVWNIPLVTEDTEVIFTVIVTDDRGPVEFDSVPWTVSPPLELSEIQYLEPAQATVDFPVTFIRTDSGSAPRIFRFRELPEGVTVGGDCVPPEEGTTDFDVLQLDCTLTFPTADDYTMTVELRDGCADQTEGNPKPLIAYDFTVTVIE